MKMKMKMTNNKIKTMNFPNIIKKKLMYNQLNIKLSF